jgi:Holliday junction resolvase RusA-like endonuclease
MIVEYFIPGKPIAWIRPGNRKGRYYDTQKDEKLVVGLQLIKQHGDNPKFQGAVEIKLVFSFGLPKIGKEISTYSIPMYTKPDLDNLVKFYLDAITDTDKIWSDDRQAYCISSQKLCVSGMRIGTYIIITDEISIQ